MTTKEFLRIARAVASDKSGVTAMEYGVIAAATVVAVTAAFTSVGHALSAKFHTLSTTLGGS